MSRQDLLLSPDSPKFSRDDGLLPDRMRDYLAISATEPVENVHDLGDTEPAGFGTLMWEYFPAHARHTTGRSAAGTHVW